MICKAGNHLYYVFHIIRFLLLRTRNYTKIGRKGHQHTPDQLMRCWKPSKLPIDFFWCCMCGANCIGNSNNVMIISLLNEISNGLPDDAHELMGFN